MTDLHTQLKKDGFHTFDFDYLFQDTETPYHQRLAEINTFEAALTQELPRSIAVAVATLNRAMADKPTPTSTLDPSKSQIDVAKFVIESSLTLAKLKAK